MTGPDAYESVLGLPPGPRPPNHYELLGIALFEKSNRLIAAAADQRVIDAEASVLASADRIRQVVSEIRQAKTCLLNGQTKAAYDQLLKQRILEDAPIELAEAAPVAEGSRSSDDPPDVPQFAPIPTDLLNATRPTPVKKRKVRVWFWTFTLFEVLCVVGLVVYLRSSEPVDMPNLPVRARVAPEPPKAVSPPVAQPVPRRPPSVRREATRDPFAPADTGGDNHPPLLTGQDMAEETVAPPPGPLSAAAAEPPRETPLPIRPHWPIAWTLHFVVNGDWTIDNEMLSLDADEIKALSALREQPVFTLRDASTKKPIAVLPFDNQGHLNGVAVALLPKNDWRACLSYSNQVLQGWAMVLDDHRNCVCFAEYRNKGRTKLLCLCADGVPVAVQIWRGKEFAAFLVELDGRQPVARGQKDLSPEQTERLAAALAELASIEAVIRDCERDWKAQLTEWWNRHDNALRTISALSIADGEKQSRKTAYYKKLFDEQHVGLDKLLSQFDTASSETAVPKP